MTSPSLCVNGTIRIGMCAGRMDMCLYPGYVFDGAIQLTDATGTPTNWPVGTLARMRVITDGTGSEVLLYDSDAITDSWLRFHLTASETMPIGRRSEIYVDLNYDGQWRPWATGRRGGGCR